MSYRTCLNRFDHAINEARLVLVSEEQMATVLETNVLVGRLHLHVGPLVHDRITDLVLHSVHDGYRNAIDLRQIDQLRVPLAGSPFLKALRLLEAALNGNLREVHECIDSNSLCIKSKVSAVARSSCSTIFSVQ